MPEIVQAEDRGQKGQQRKIALLIALLAALIALGVLGYLYLHEGRQLDVLPGPAGPGAPHFVFSIDVENPVSVAVSPLGDRIFISEGSGDRLVHIVDRSGTPISEFSLTRYPLDMRTPGALAVSPDGNLYVVDTYNREILIYSSDGEYISAFIPDGNPDFGWVPTGLTFDKSRNLYVTDQTENRHRVLVFDPTGKLKLKFGLSGKGDGMFLFPTDILVDPDGRIFVADSANSRIQVFDSSGNFISIIHGTDLYLPRALLRDSDGRLHILDSLNHSVLALKLDKDKTDIAFRYGTLGREAGQFYFPSDITEDETGRIYIADSFNNRIQVFSF